MIINIPFPGFYESLFSGAIDNAESQDSEYRAEQESSLEYYPETFQPEHLRLDASDYQGIYMACSNYSAAYRQVAEWYVDAFDRLAHETLGTPVGSFVFESMDSPREYNFATDRIFATVDESVMREMLANVDRVALETVATERFTSYDGFISSYSPDVDDWGDLADWDHNQLATLLIAAMGDLESDDLRWELYESTMGDGADDQAWESCVDWPKVESMIADRREEKMEEAIEAGLVPEPIDVPYRCPLTLELPL